MKDLTLKFEDRADFSAFMESIGYYDDESMQDDILIDVIGNVYKETGELTEDGEPVLRDPLIISPKRNHV